MPTLPRGREPWSTALGALTLLVILLLGLANLWQPFTWDQAVFALGADALERGGTLYRDYWDFKQPGIFWFFQLAEHLFGLSEGGIHALEIAWMLLLAVVLQRTTRGWFRHRAAAMACPLLVAGLYFALCTDWHLLQVEGLVGLPLFIAVRAQATRRTSGRAMLAGLAGGVVLVFKLALLPIVLVAWLYQAWVATAPASGTRRALGALVGALAIPLAAMAVVLAAVAAHFAARGALGIAWWTWTRFPLQVLATIHGLPLVELRSTLKWVATSWWALVLCGLAGAVLALRTPRDVLGRSLVLWLLAGSGVIVMQRWSGYAYHFLLLLVPLGLLASRALELALERWFAARGATPVARVTAALALVLLFAGPLAAGVRKVRGAVGAAAGAHGRFDSAARQELLERSSDRDAYRYYGRITAFLQDPRARPGPIYVFGNPLAYWISGRTSASSRPGCMSVFGPREWRTIADDIERNRTPYLLVEDPAVAMLVHARPASEPVLELLRTRYRKGGRMERGVWYERREADNGP